jgi:hypothetical protein
MPRKEDGMANFIDQRETGDSAAAGNPALQLVIDALARLKYGAIQLTVHEGRLVQVDVTERSRFPA